jgi:hypothetical protein
MHWFARFVMVLALLGVSCTKHLARELERAELRVSLLLRVPADRFEPALGELRNLGRGVGREQVTDQDVTEAFIDLEARIRTKRAW